ncbi:hypothetical protein [Paenibacillus terrigena]|uniref:hypothetical protein n=1 Tax=Paenibacillus terrigena TaxID=369333 RepID=UPI0028D8C966|nr:hypothetical protein [Paenibacillus terrigena]
MRIREIEQIVKENFNNLEVEITGYNSTNNKYYVSNFQKTIDSIKKLSQFDFIAEEVGILKSFDFIYYNSDEADKVYVDSNTYNAVLNARNDIIKKCYTVLSLVKEALPTEESEDSIDVKLPEYKDLNKISDFFDTLNKALEIIVVNKDINGKVQLQSFESGSLWLNIIVGAKAVKWIGIVMEKVMEVRHKYYETEKLKAGIKSLNNVNDAQELIIKALDVQVKEFVEVKTNEVLSDGTIANPSPEYTARMQYSIQALAELVYQGAEIHAALGSPREIKNEYPKYLEFDKTEIKSIKENSEVVDQKETEINDDEEK